jgi:hypothetical protein
MRLLVIDTDRPWDGATPDGVEFEMVRSENYDERENSFVRFLDEGGPDALALVHNSDLGDSWGEESFDQKILSSPCSLLIYSTSVLAADKTQRELLKRGCTDNLRDRIVSHDESIIRNTELSDVFGEVVRLWSKGHSLSQAYVKAKESRGEGCRDQLIAFRILLDCSILLANPQHEAFVARVSEEVRQVAERPRDASFWGPYWEPVKEFVTASLETPPNMAALNLPEKEENTLSECLRHVAERLQEHGGRPDPDAKCVKSYLAVRFSE